MRVGRFLIILVTCLAAMLALPASPAFALPSFNKIVVVIEENHSYSEVIGNSNAP